MPSHFYVPQLTATDPPSPLLLEKDRSHYLQNVLRLRPGDTLSCFDGQGGRCTARIEGTGRKLALIIDASTLSSDPEPSSHTHMILAQLKGQAMDRSIQLCVEMGASSVSIVKSSRTNVSLDRKRLANKLAHWQKIAIGACEQSGRAWLPCVEYFDQWAPCLEKFDTTCLIRLDSTGSLLTSGTRIPLSRAIVIGAEGGFEPREIQLLEVHGAMGVSLGRATLRAETAPAAILSLLDFLDRNPIE